LQFISNYPNKNHGIFRQQHFVSRCCKILLHHVAALLAAASVQAQDCNICGEGNSIQYPQGVVEFEYQGEKRKNNCQEWQRIVMNPNAINDDFCRNEMLNYTMAPCLCTTADGKLLTDLAASTIAPSGNSVRIDDSSPSAAPPKNQGKNSSVVACEQANGSKERCTDAESNKSSGSSQITVGALWISSVVAWALATV
jgi:hypothetical protein